MAIPDEWVRPPFIRSLIHPNSIIPLSITLPAQSNAPFLRLLLLLHLPLSVPVLARHFSPTNGRHHHRNPFTISSFTNFSMESSSVEEDDIPGRRKKGDELAWLHSSANRKSQLAQFITKAMVGPRSWIGGIFNRSGNKRFGIDKFIDYPFTPVQEERLQRLHQRLHVPYDETYPDHQEALVALWNAAYPDVPLKGLISEQWKDMGWQGCNPSTDFRGCGFLALENLLYFVRTYPVSFHRLLFKEGGERAEWEYPFAVAGINVSFMLIQMLDLHSAKPRCLPGVNFVKLLGEDEDAFDELYCVAFAMMDAQWLAMRASYMEFNEVLQVTRTQLERELSLEDLHKIHDLPAFNLLYQ